MAILKAAPYAPMTQNLLPHQVDLSTQLTRTIRLKPDPNCALCGPQASITDLSAHMEGALDKPPWTMAKNRPETLDKMMRMIVPCRFQVSGRKVHPTGAKRASIQPEIIGCI